MCPWNSCQWLDWFFGEIYVVGAVTVVKAVPAPQVFRIPFGLKNHDVCQKKKVLNHPSEALYTFANFD